MSLVVLAASPDLQARVSGRNEFVLRRDQYARGWNTVDSKLASGTVVLSDMQTAIEVTDDGPGLPEQVRRNLFQPFTGSTRVGGSGLGLSIARDLMRGHGGDVELGRTGKDGTTFRLTLPVETGLRDRQAPTAAHG